MICLKETRRRHKLPLQQTELSLTFGLLPYKIRQRQIVFTNHYLFTMVGKINELGKLRFRFRDIDIQMNLLRMKFRLTELK